MILKVPSPKPLHLRVVFELPTGISADHIHVVGAWNNWDEEATPFQRQANGCWRLVLDLPVGHRYAFRYRVDDHWQTDSHADASATLDDVRYSFVDTHLPLLPAPHRAAACACREAKDGQSVATHAKTVPYWE